MPDKQPDVRGHILIASANPPRLLDRYITARNSLELSNSLQRHSDTLQLAVVFSDFELTTKHAQLIKQSLPFIIVDRSASDSAQFDQPGLGVLLTNMSFYDRVAVYREDRWEVLRAQFDLQPCNREYWPDSEQPGLLEKIAANGYLPEQRTTPPHTDPDQEQHNQRRDEPDLRKLKVTHLAEQALVSEFLNGITARMTDPRHLRVLEFGCSTGRWCHFLNTRFHHTGTDPDERLVARAQRYFPDQRFFSTARLHQMGNRPGFDVGLSVDMVNTGCEGDLDRLLDLLEFSRGGMRFLMIEDFNFRASGNSSPPAGTIRAFEAALWEASRGRLLLERCEVVRYPYHSAPQTRALLQTRWLGD